MIPARCTLLVSSLLPFVLGRPASDTSRLGLVVREQLQEPPAGFRAHSTFEGALRLTIAMPQRDVTGLYAALQDLSDPTSGNYGRFLTKSEVEGFVAPEPESLEIVNSWLDANDVLHASSSPSGDMITIELPAEKANTLLDANFTSYVHEASNTITPRTLSYSLPAEIQKHIHYIYPTTHFTSPSRRMQFKAIHPPRSLDQSDSQDTDPTAACSQEVTPACLQALYNIPSTPATAEGNVIGVSGFTNQVPNQEDLTQFLDMYRPDAPNGTFSFQSIDAGITNGSGTREASLDTQYTVGLATNVPVRFLSVGDSGNSELDEINFLLGEDRPPLVLTTSYGANEGTDAGFASIAQTLCTAFAQLGARGVSVLFSSGDGGVAGNHQSECSGQPFIASWPSVCPYVTSVGATQNVSPEVAANFSSGGFSVIFPRPSYQDDAVEGYLTALGNTNAGLFNSTGRAFPDVALQGVNLPVIVNGTTLLAHGTSASTPAFAAMVALVNDQLLNAGKPPLGFLNPLLYSKAAAGVYNDITSGSNPGCGTDGFSAAPGWDPVTGLGTPDFTRLLSVAMNASSR